jgi:hypothetical protein
MNQATLQHELTRIETMTDDQLVTRYGKMRNTAKITTFLAALQSMGRAPDLQRTIELRLELPEEATRTNWGTVGFQLNLS